MRIGTDVSLDTCRAEGYMTMLIDKADLKRFDPEKWFTFGKTLPDYVSDVHYKFSKYYTGSHSANSLWELYTSRKEGIDSCCGMEHEFPTDVYGLLSLASDVDSYMGEIIDNYGQ